MGELHIRPGDVRAAGTTGRIRAELSRRLLGSDLALGYAGVVTALAVTLTMLPVRVADHLVIDSSTNLANLRAHPPFVLVVSAFVEPSVWQLWILVPLLLAYAELQRWLGRAAVVITAVLGHVGATLFVSTILAAGIAHGRIALSVRNATDVGVSYGLVAVLGLLTARIPRRWRPWYVIGLTLGFVVSLLGWRSFTELGHFSAWVIGLGLAVLVHRAQRLPSAPQA
ncbi:MAG TPA: rhomboid-like protein [Kineosporiaceae bacterium]|nr:rhomboid-like protein [Kineosporiaceae bacterium]